MGLRDYGTKIYTNVWKSCLSKPVSEMKKGISSGNVKYMNVKYVVTVVIEGDK